MQYNDALNLLNDFKAGTTTLDDLVAAIHSIESSASNLAGLSTSVLNLLEVNALIAHIKYRLNATTFDPIKDPALWEVSKALSVNAINVNEVYMLRL